MVLRFVAHSKRVLKIAAQYGWLPGARYTNLRDIREFPQVGFIDIDWNHYSFRKHLAAVKSTNPLMTVARDIERLSDLSETLDQAHELRQHCKYVIIVPKHPSLATRTESIRGAVRTSRRGIFINLSARTLSRWAAGRGKPREGKQGRSPFSCPQSFPQLYFIVVTHNLY
jgi:hypothetical protein